MLITRLGVGALATFLAIVLWSNTRDPAWMLIIMGTIIRYGEIIYSTFQVFGILRTEAVVFGVPMVRLVLVNLPPVLYAVGFVVALSRSRLR
jgi:hypothetical protein